MRVASICVSGLLLAVGFVLSMGVIVVAALFMVNGIHFGVGSAWQTETEGRFLVAPYQPQTTRRAERRAGPILNRPRCPNLISFFQDLFCLVCDLLPLADRQTL